MRIRPTTPTYIAAALDALRGEGDELDQVALGHLSPAALHLHVSPYGKSSLAGAFVATPTLVA